ncbi:family 20 glycosylhydrolase [Sphingobacterium chungjuense]|uniref:family 20 glycosylhydrolase n=1 Tax=Sphingobacterium chungjuense TaxID=2675553 RepID=UPI0014087D8C|nr:family 20 glycosylhydrolase [Sphingobacterium chungjuense]
MNKRYAILFTAIIAILYLSGCTRHVAPLPVLFPYPQYVVVGDQVAQADTSFTISLDGLDTAVLSRLLEVAGGRLAEEGLRLALIADSDIAIIPDAAKPWLDSIGTEGYILEITNADKRLVAHTEAGLFYGLQTYKQLLRAGYDRDVLIADWPSFKDRVVFDDISRGPISTVAYAKEQIRRLAELKVNGFSCYIEHVFRSEAYPDFSPDDGHFTVEDIRELSAYAEKHHIKLIGNFQSFGHFRNILSQPAYADLGETINLISPNNPKAKQFLETVLGELCTAFNSPYFHVNCDETFDLGKGKSKAYVDSVGIATYYADHIRFLYDVVKSHGKQLMIWGDIVLEHEEILDMLPKDIIYMTWEYSNHDSYDKWIKPFASRGLPYMVCPGVLNSLRLFPDVATAIANIDGFTAAGHQAGARGVFTTIWDEGGQDQLFSMDWYPVSMAAAKSWNAEQTLDAKQDEHFERVVYGTDLPSVVPAIRQLVELSNLPLTYNMSDAVWWQDLLPSGVDELLLNNTDVPSALDYVSKADSLLSKSTAVRNQTDLLVLQYIIDRYKLLLKTRLIIASQAEKGQVIPHKIQSLRKEYEDLQSRFVRLWHRENQQYSLDYALKPYQSRIADLDRLLGDDRVALNRVHVSPHYYFGYWLLSGPFSASPQISGVYSDDVDQNHPPKPGDFTRRGDKTLRWTKVNSSVGGFMPINGKGSRWYAYAKIHVDEDTSIVAHWGHAGRLNLNGVWLTGNPSTEEGVLPEFAYTLRLKRGYNDILLEMHAVAETDRFTFRLATPLPVINHKHKYTLNPNPNKHEAD